MAETWANLGLGRGLDLHVEPSRHGARRTLEESLRGAIRDGRLRAGTRLPPSRGLADDLGVARNTVAEAYGQLVAEGWLSARTGAGTWVVEHAAQPGGASTRPATSAPRPAVPRHDLRPGLPDLSGFPRLAWAAATRRALGRAPYHDLGYGDPRGQRRLREALAGYLGRVRGAVADPADIVVCGGFAEGLELVCRVLSQASSGPLALEGYGLPRHRAIARAAGLAVRSLDMDSEGARVADLGRAGAALLTAAHQFPLGMALSPTRRREVVEWAGEGGGIVIEDDYDGEFRYDRAGVGALQALAPDSVVYAGTASKALGPGVGLGWLVLPPRLLEPVVDLRRTLGRSGSAIDQLALADLVESGSYDRHVRRARLAYRRRRDRLVEALASGPPGLRVHGLSAGMHALVSLPPGQTEASVVEAGARRGLALSGLGDFALGSRPRPEALVVGYATPSEHGYASAVAALVATLRDVVG